MKFSKIFLSISISLVMIVIPSCTKKISSPNEQTIYYRISDEPVTLDPQIANDASSRLVIMNIFEGLVKLDNKNEPIRGAADSWKMNGMEYEFHIRDGAKWSDGSPLTANDFLYGFQRTFMPLTDSQTAKTLFCIKNSEKIKKGQLDMSYLGVYAENEHTLKIQLDYQDPQFLSLLATPPAMPCKKDFFESTAGQYGLEYDKIVSNGAFCVSRYGWEHEKYIRLSRNDNYKGENSVIPRNVNIDISDSPEDVCSAVANKEIDCYSMDITELQQAKANKLNLTAFNDTVWGICFNMQNEVLSKPDIRRSLLQSLDRKYILRNLPEGCIPAEDIVPETARADNMTYRSLVGRGMGIEFSENAKEYFKNAVAALNYHEDEYYYWYYDYDEVEFPDIDILCTDEPSIQPVVNSIIETWNRLTGKYANKTPVPREELMERIASGDYLIAIAPLKPDGESPVDTLKLFMSNSEVNISGVSDEVYDSLISDILQKPDNTSINKMIQAERYLNDNGIFYPLYTESRYYVSAENVHGIVFHPYGAEADFSSAEKILK